MLENMYARVRGRIQGNGSQRDNIFIIKGDREERVARDKIGQPVKVQQESVIRDCGNKNQHGKVLGLEFRQQRPAVRFALAHR